MQELFQATPICLIKDASVKWEITYSIYPIQLENASRISELIEDDPIYADLDVNFVSQAGKVTRIVVNADQYWLDLAEMSDSLEKSLNDLIDKYLGSNGGYEAARA